MDLHGNDTEHSRRSRSPPRLRQDPARGGGDALLCRSGPYGLLSAVPLAALLIVGCTMCIAMADCSDADGYDYTDANGIGYKIIDGTYTVEVVHCGDSISGGIRIDSPVTIGGESYKVVSISSSVFESRTSLTSIVLPDTVTSIGNSAFNSCTGLTSITMSGVESIGDKAFFRCTSLAFTLPGSLTAIGSMAFQQTKPDSVNIPSSVTSIGDRAFMMCTSLTTITVNDANTAYSAEDGVLFNKSKTSLIQYPAGKTDSDYTVPNSVSSIGSFAFAYNGYITGVGIPGSVTSIGSCAFGLCTSLASIDIPNSVTSIKNDTFYGCTQLASISMDSVTSIENNAFVGCTSLASIRFGEGIASIDSKAFGPDPSTPTEFYKEGGGDRIYPETDVGEFKGKTFAGSINRMVMQGSGPGPHYDSFVVDGIRYDVIDWDDGTALVGNQGRGASGDVTIPANVAYEGKGWTITEIGDEAFEKCNDLTSVVIEDGIQAIGDDAFGDCPKLVSVTIPASVGEIDIEYHPFSSCTSLTTITVDAANRYLCAVDNVLYNKDMTVLLQYPAGSAATEFTIPSSVTALGEEAMKECNNLVSVTIPSSVTTLLEEALADCEKLESVTILGSIVSEDTPFFNCPSINTVRFGDDISTMCPYLFGYEDEDGTLKLTKFYKANGTDEVDFSNIEDIRGATFKGDCAKMVMQGSGPGPDPDPDDDPIWDDDDDWTPTKPSSDPDYGKKSDESTSILIIVACVAAFMAILTVLVYSPKR